MKATQNTSNEGQIKKIRHFVGRWFVKHPNTWINPLSVYSIYRALSGHIRVLPDFIIIGASKSGTSFLYENIVKHPSTFRAIWKEIFFFDRYYSHGLTWYKGNFHSIIYKNFVKHFNKKSFITGEATPTYLHHPQVAERVSATLPNVKLIALLRNPIDRAYSHYQMEVRLGNENLSFEDALKAEEKRLAGEKEKMLKNPNYYSKNYQMYSYQSRGIYIHQLKEWHKHFGNDQLLIIKTEDLENHSSEILNQIFDFLGLSKYDIKNIEKVNVGKYQEMKESNRKYLEEYFKPYNEQLYKYLGIDFGW